MKNSQTVSMDPDMTIIDGMPASVLTGTPAHSEALGGMIYGQDAELLHPHPRRPGVL